MFTEAGTLPVTIREVILSDPKFSKGEDDFDICVLVAKKDDEGQQDWWHGEMSNAYCTGAFAGMTRAQVTMKTLASVGLEGGMCSLEKMKEKLIGHETTATIKASEKDGKTFYNVSYIGGGNAPSKIAEKEAARRYKALMADSPEPVDAGKSPFSPDKAKTDDDNLNMGTPPEKEKGTPAPEKETDDEDPFK